jgi:hypothetical protein
MIGVRMSVQDIKHNYKCVLIMLRSYCQRYI